jgi:hypothetical protein
VEERRLEEERKSERVTSGKTNLNAFKRDALDTLASVEKREKRITNCSKTFKRERERERERKRECESEAV